LTFESNSTLDQIGPGVFSGCSLLKSICIPSSVTILGEEWCTDDLSVIREGAVPPET
jgi:hypothetical protein